MKSAMKSWKRELAAAVMFLFWLLVLHVALEGFPEAGVQLIGVLVAPVFLLNAAAFGLQSVATQWPAHLPEVPKK